MDVRRALRMFAMATVSASTGCAGLTVDSLATPATLVGTHGEELDLAGIVAGAPLTVLVFFSPHCSCLRVHEARLRALYDASRAHGVVFLMVDSEVQGSVVRDDDEARRRGYPFPVVRDEGAKLADALGAEYASYSVVIDRHGRVRYRGGIDSDKTHLHEDASAYLRDALGDLLAGRPPRVTEGKTLGCALEKR